MPGFSTSIPYTDDGLGGRQNQAHGYPTHYKRDEHLYPSYSPSLPLTSIPVYPADGDERLRGRVHQSSAAYELAMDKLKHVSGSFRF